MSTKQPCHAPVEAPLRRPCHSPGRLLRRSSGWCWRGRKQRHHLLDLLRHLLYPDLGHLRRRRLGPASDSDPGQSLQCGPGAVRHGGDRRHVRCSLRAADPLHDCAGRQLQAHLLCARGFGGPSPLSINTICTIPPAPPERKTMANGSVSPLGCLLPGGPRLDLSGGRRHGLHGSQRCALRRVHQKRDLQSVPAEQPKQPEFPRRPARRLPPIHVVLGGG
jgi:hypothetical protein